jgi:hypothetical protein
MFQLDGVSAEVYAHSPKRQRLDQFEHEATRSGGMLGGDDAWDDGKTGCGDDDGEWYRQWPKLEDVGKPHRDIFVAKLEQWREARGGVGKVGGCEAHYDAAEKDENGTEYSLETHEELSLDLDAGKKGVFEAVEHSEQRLRKRDASHSESKRHGAERRRGGVGWGCAREGMLRLSDVEGNWYADESGAKYAEHGAHGVVAEEILAPEKAGDRDEGKEKRFQAQKVRKLKVLQACHAQDAHDAPNGTEQGHAQVVESIRVARWI